MTCVSGILRRWDGEGRILRQNWRSGAHDTFYSRLLYKMLVARCSSPDAVAALVAALLSY